eukprot:SAG31_NODE_5799_length_2323_cov_1.375899_1_plen_86_part_00
MAADADGSAAHLEERGGALLLSGLAWGGDGGGIASADPRAAGSAGCGERTLREEARSCGASSCWFESTACSMCAAAGRRQQPEER